VDGGFLGDDDGGAPHGAPAVVGDVALREGAPAPQVGLVGSEHHPPGGGVAPERQGLQELQRRGGNAQTWSSSDQLSGKPMEVREKLPPSQPEHNVIRTWLEYVIELP
jgi:hypothetical protein